MGRGGGVAKRRRKNATGSKRKPRSKMQKMRNKLKKKPTIQCGIIKENWNEKSTMRKNLSNMGLAPNPNDVIGLPKPGDMFKDVSQLEEMDIDMIPKLEAADDKARLVEANAQPVSSLTSKKKRRQRKTKGVAAKLEEEAAKPTTKNFSLSSEMMKFCVYMHEKHGTNYKAMQYDDVNVYQKSAGAIKKLIKKMRNTPSSWNAYCTAKSMIGDEPPNAEAIDQNIEIDSY